ncbi:hypothetical protein Baya_14978 [Bagarius yarrelli]|uniref:Uncharacterized protein n=1 Tax=Bagarius yarrelli TaxID=175774 RepID=A0A556VAR3_BAGYA|nr:hypothetical protein Baya_14978 [Bagarius yarrelli]
MNNSDEKDAKITQLSTGTDNKDDDDERRVNRIREDENSTRMIQSSRYTKSVR